MSDNPYAQPNDFAGGTEYLEPKTSILAIFAFIVSLIGLIACCVPGIGPLGLLLGVLALVLISMSGGRKKGGGLAIAAIVIGLIAGAINVSMVIGASIGGQKWAELGVVLVEVEDRDLQAVQGRLVSAQTQQLDQAQLEAFASSINSHYGSQQEPPKGLMDVMGLMMEVGQRMQNAQTDVQGEYSQSSYGAIPLALRYDKGAVLFMLIVPSTGSSAGLAYSNVGYFDPSGNIVWMLPTPSGQGAVAQPSLPGIKTPDPADPADPVEGGDEPGEG